MSKAGKLKDRTTYSELVEEATVIVEEEKKKEFDELPKPDFKDGIQGSLF